MNPRGLHDVTAWAAASSVGQLVTNQRKDPDHDMLKHIILRQLAAFEQQFDYSMDYAREVVNTGPLVFKRFYDANKKLSSYRSGITKNAWHAAKILGVLSGDCGPCAQLVVTMAAKDGVGQGALHQLLTGDFDALPKDMQLCAKFTQALLQRAPELPQLRDAMRSDHGTPPLISVAYAVLAGQMFPTLKYALGYAEGCQQINLGQALVAPSVAAELEPAA